MVTITRFQGRERRGTSVPVMPSTQVVGASSQNLQQIGQMVEGAGKLISKVNEDNERSLFDLNYATMKNTVGEKQVAYRKAMETADIKEQEVLTANYKKELEDLRIQIVTDPNGGDLYRKLIGTKSDILVGARQNEADLDAFQYKRRNTSINLQASQQQRKLTNQGLDYEINRAETLGAMASTDNQEILGEKDKFRHNKNEANNYVESIGSGALASEDPQQILKAFDEIKMFQSSTYRKADGEEGKVSELVDREVIDRTLARLKRGQNASVKANERKSNEMFQAVKDGYKRGFTGNELTEKASLLEAQFLASGDTAKFEELQIYKGLGRFKESLWGKTEAQKNAMLEEVLAGNEVEVDGEKYQVSLNAFNTIHDLKGTMETMIREDERMKENNPYEWVGQQFPKISPEENMRIQREAGIKYPIPFPEATYQNVVQLARSAGVGRASAQIRQDYAEYLPEISAKLSGDKQNSDLGQLSLALMASPQFADQVVNMTKPERVETIKTGFRNSQYKNSDLKDQLSKNDDFVSLQSQLNISGQGGLSNAMAEVIRLDAMERIGRNIKPKDAMTQAVRHWKDNMFQNYDTNLNLNSQVNIPRSIIKDAQHQADINHAIASIDRTSLVNFGYSYEVADSIIRNSMPVVQGTKIRFMNISDSKEYVKETGEALILDVNELNNPELNPVYDDYIKFKNGTARSRWIRDDSLRLIRDGGNIGN